MRFEKSLSHSNIQYILKEYNSVRTIFVGQFLLVYLPGYTLSHIKNDRHVSANSREGRICHTCNKVSLRVGKGTPGLLCDGCI